MKLSSRFFSALISLCLLSTVVSFAANTGVEGTPPPMPPKPDWSTMNFLVGTWTCTDLSSRRPGPFTVTKVYSKDPGGYWMTRNDTTHKASWIKRELHTTYRYTWDDVKQKWIRIGMGDLGGYEVAEAPMPVNGRKTWTFITQRIPPDIASYTPEVYQRTGDTKITMTSSFREKTGRLVNVKESCSKT